jgi:hypothetical protein
MELSRGLGMDSKVYGTAFRRGLKSGRGELQESNIKLSKPTSKKNVIIGFEAYSCLCLY